jgi:putative ABC transport system permease protein
MVAPSPALIVVLVVLLVLAVAAVALAGLPLRQAMVTASVRAGVQLAVVSALLVVVFGSVAWTFLYVAAMFVVAAWTSARRVHAQTPVWTAAPIAAGTVPVVGVVLASGAVPWKPASILPVAGIVLGGAMTSTSLAAQRMFDELNRRQGEYEAALSLGFLPRDAVLEIARQSSGLALVPALDQTRTVGLVTLPGAFVGVLLGGGSPAAAGAAQVLVLVGLLAAESIAVLVVGELVARRLLTTRELASRLPA